MILAATLEDVANGATIVGLVFAVIVGYIAIEQLKAAVSASETSAILAIDEAFARFDNLRHRINAGTNVETVEVVRYLYLWQRLGYLIRSDVLTAEVAESYYSHRFGQLLRHGDARQILGRRIADNPKVWADVVLVWKRFHELRDPHDTESVTESPPS